MIYSPSNTGIFFCNVPLEDYKNQIYFTSRSAQLEYFNSKIVKSFINYTYQRKDEYIKVNANIETLYNCNYCFYRNETYTNRYFFAFIIDMMYLSPETTIIKIKTDVFQTWFLDCNFLPSFVAREHIEGDTIGANLVPESLETGELIQHNRFGQIRPMYWLICVISTVDLNDPSSDGMWLNKYGKSISPRMWAYMDVTDLIHKLIAVNAASKIDGIVSMFLAPDWAIKQIDTTTDEVLSFDENFKPEALQQIPISEMTIDGYTPKNKKLFTAPYANLQIFNYNGQNIELDYEYLPHNENNIDIEFNSYAQCIDGGKACLWPKNYRGMDNALNHAIYTTEYPKIPWINDVYANWINQNKLGLFLSGAGGTAAIAMSGGNPVAIAGGIATIANSLNQIYQHSIMPNQARGTIGGDTLIDINNWGFDIWQCGITAEYARIIDDYFTMFGYATNRVKIPNLNTRPNWNYVKTIDCNITADIPIKDLQEVKQIFNSGVTLWHNVTNFGNYSVNNQEGGN